MIDLPKFPFVYSGGGHFRDSRVPKGQSAPMLHGNEVLAEYEKFVKDYLEKYVVVNPTDNLKEILTNFKK